MLARLESELKTATADLNDNGLRCDRTLDLNIFLL